MAPVCLLYCVAWESRQALSGLPNWERLGGLLLVPAGTPVESSGWSCLHEVSLQYCTRQGSTRGAGLSAVDDRMAHGCMGGSP